MKVWSWRNAVQKSGLMPMTKLVLFNLSIYMNELGQGCYPTTKKQAEDTGLSERSVCTHLDYAVGAGFIRKKTHGFSGQGWSRNEYLACLPVHVELSHEAEEIDEEGTEPNDADPQKALKEVQPLYKKALNVVQEGTEPDDRKALKEVQSNSPLNTPVEVVDVSARKDISHRKIVKEIREVFPLGEQIAEVVGWKDDPRWMGSYSRLTAWLAVGWDFELDILPTVKAVMAARQGKPPPSSLNYFEKAIANAYATRMQPVPEGKSNGSGTSKRKSAVDAMFAGFATAIGENRV